jgi:ribonuclease HI
MRMLYEGLVLSLLLYCVEVWYPTADVDYRARLRSIHYRGCRLITGCAATTDMASVLAEAGFPTLDELVVRKMVTAHEMFRRVPLGGRRSFGLSWVARLVALEPYRDDPVRLPRGGTAHKLYPWVDARVRPPNGLSQEPTIRDVARELPVAVDEVLPIPWHLPYAPFDTKGYERIRFDATPPGGLRKHDKEAGGAPPDDEHLRKLREANEARLQAVLAGAPTFVVLSDGSVCPADPETGAPPKAAGAALVFAGTDLEAEPVASMRRPAGQLACSFTAEAWALHAALEWCASPDNVPDGSTISVFTDSLSALAQLNCGPLRQKFQLAVDCWSFLLQLGNRGCSVSLHFVFSHCGFAPGDRIDEAAAAARDAVGHEAQRVWHVDAARARMHAASAVLAAAVPVPTTSKRSRARGAVRPVVAVSRGAPGYASRASFRARHATAEVLKHSPKYWFSKEWTRAAEITLYQLRCGVCPELGGHLHEEVLDCPRCDAVGCIARGGAAVEHLFACPAECAVRARAALGVDSPAMLWTHPGKAMAYWYCWLRNEAPVVEGDNAPAVGAALAAVTEEPVVSTRRPHLPRREEIRWHFKRLGRHARPRGRPARPPPPPYGSVARPPPQYGAAPRPPPPSYEAVERHWLPPDYADFLSALVDAVSLDVAEVGPASQLEDDATAPLPLYSYLQ